MRLFGMLSAIALVGLFAQAATAGDCGCAGVSGCNTGCCDPCCNDGGCGNGKHCELKIGKKKIKVTCYGCKCDTICLPCPSQPGCKHCENLCGDNCGSCGCSCECDHKPNCVARWRDWCPGGAVSYDRKVLVKYEAEKEVPDYKWVVVDCCAPSKDGGAAPTPANQPPLPPAPKPASYRKAAPANAKIGEEFTCTPEEIKQIESKLQQVSYTEVVNNAKNTNAKTTTRTATQQKPAVRTAAKDALPWGLFSK